MVFVGMTLTRNVRSSKRATMIITVRPARSGMSSSIAFMDGQYLTLILEGHVSLTDALDLKIQKAAQEGIIFFR